jgi:hypothetical protein
LSSDCSRGCRLGRLYSHTRPHSREFTMATTFHQWMGKRAEVASVALCKRERRARQIVSASQKDVVRVITSGRHAKNETRASIPSGTACDQTFRGPHKTPNTAFSVQMSPWVGPCANPASIAIYKSRQMSQLSGKRTLRIGCWEGSSLFCVRVLRVLRTKIRRFDYQPQTRKSVGLITNHRHGL